MKPRVFVSSVVGGFETMRQAARRGIEAAGLEPILVNEDSPSRSDSPRNACLDAIESCDVFVLVLGGRGGSTAPSGKLVIEEEYEHAKSRNLPILAFIQAGERDVAAAHLAERLSSYVGGHLRTEFREEGDLESSIRNAVAAQAALLKTKTMLASDLEKDLAETGGRQDDASLRVAIAPERDEEVIDILSLENSTFKDEVFRIAHESSVGLFRYESRKETDRTDEGWAFQQEHEWGRRNVAHVRLEVRSSGRIILDRQISSLGEPGGLGGLSITEADLREALRSSLAFARRFFDRYDPYERHSNFWFGAAVHNRGFRMLVPEAPRGSVSFGVSGREMGPVQAEAPRLISRSDLTAENTIERTVAWFRRKLS